MKGNNNTNKNEINEVCDWKWDNIAVVLAILSVDALYCCFIGNFYQNGIIVFFSIILGAVILSIENKTGKTKWILDKAISFFWEKRIKDDERSLLSPCMVEKDSPAYSSVEELLYVSKKEGSRNIALTGVYGSGKSSILKTFMSQLPKRTRVLQISLSNFLSIDASEEDIEKKVFQHIIFKANQAETAQTEFDRKSVISRNRAYAHAICLVFIILCVLLITKSSLISVPHIKAAISGILGENNNLYDQFSTWWYVFFSAFVVVYAVYIIKHIIRRVPKLKLKYVGKEGLEFDFDKKDVFNRMLGEIVYFLKAGKYDMVIFEDLDRIKDPRNLFLKLRELNLLINESDDYIKNNKTIRFIYAIRDDVYREELRTKIFDYIIPVIPIVDKFNAGDYLIDKYGNKNELMFDIKKGDLKELGSYIDNMRTLKNVVNEYRLYKEAIGDNAESSNQLLALTIYKNLFPSDYSLLHQKRGCLYAITSNPDRTEIKQTCNNYLKKNCQLYNMTEEEIVLYAESISTTIEDMLNKGYLPEDIDSYISCFKTNPLIKSDNDFCKMVVIGDKDEPSLLLHDPWSVVMSLPEDAFKLDGILNYDIADAIFSNCGASNEKGILFINTMMNNTQFFLDYFDPMNSNDTIVKQRIKIMFESDDFSDALLAYIKNCSDSVVLTKLFDLVTIAANLCIANAQFVLGYCNYEGICISKTQAEAVKCYKKASKQGHAQAMFNLAEIYHKGDNIEKNIDLAIELYIKVAEHGNADAIFNLGEIYQSGDGVEKDITKAIELYTKAAKLGNADAIFNLGEIYQSGDGGKKDITKAIELYTKAAELGNADAIFNLGEIYQSGDGGKKDITKAIEWYTKAAELGHADAMFKLAEIYNEDSCLRESNNIAIEWYTKAAKHGNADAMFKLAEIYNEEGSGLFYAIDYDIDKANEWYTKAAEEGHAEAMYHLARMYESGEGVDTNMRKAYDWYAKAAEKGHIEAMYHLGEFYYNGTVVDKNIDNAIEWYNKAADKRYYDAMEKLASIYQEQKRNEEAIDMLKKMYEIVYHREWYEEEHDIVERIKTLKDQMKK